MPAKCHASNYKCQEQSLQINDSNRVVCQRNDAVRWDSGALMNAELAVAVLVNRPDHPWMVLEAAQQRCVSCTNTSSVQSLALRRGGRFPSVGSGCQLTNAELTA